MDALSVVIPLVMEDFAPQELSNVVWASATLGLVDTKVAEHAWSRSPHVYLDQPHVNDN